MKSLEIFKEVRKEIAKGGEEVPELAREDPVHSASILGEEAGEALKAALDYYYGRGDLKALKKELIHIVAMAFRFLLNLNNKKGE